MEEKSSILIIDDSKASIIALTHMLSTEYTLRVSKNGPSGIKIAKEYTPDIILLDILMPGMNGFAVLNALKGDEATRNIPVILITGLGDVDSEMKGFTLGAADYIVKPFIPGIVKLRIENQIKLIKQMNLLLEKERHENRNQAKMEILSNVSHGMLTPMNTIIGMTHIARRTTKQDTIADCLNEIDTASHELLEMIEKLLKASEENLEITPL